MTLPKQLLILSYLLLFHFTGYSQSKQSPQKKDVKKTSNKTKHQFYAPEIKPKVDEIDRSKLINREEQIGLLEGGPEILTPDRMPQFRGGKEDLYKFIYYNLQYPKIAKDSGIQGSIIAKCLIKKDGSLENVLNFEGEKLGYGCEEEVKRLLKLMPKWKPAIKNGNPVPAVIDIPFEFKLVAKIQNAKSIQKNKIKITEIKIGEQIWMQKNLNVDTFRNGDIIPEAKSYEEWESLGKNGSAAWCYYQNITENAEKYGKLYNWYAVNDPRGLAPEGWYIPGDLEWNILINYLGVFEAGNKLKSISGWQPYGKRNSNGSNESGFFGLPGGFRRHKDRYGITHMDDYSGFEQEGEIGTWWSFNESSECCAWIRGIYQMNGGEIEWSSISKQDGRSVRCVRY